MAVEPDPALFTSSGHARGGYSPFPHTINVTNHDFNPVDHHTSDGNDQHSSRDARGDCAASQSSLISCAAAAAPQSGGHDSFSTQCLSARLMK